MVPRRKLSEVSSLCGSPLCSLRNPGGKLFHVVHGDVPTPYPLNGLHQSFPWHLFQFLGWEYGRRLKVFQWILCFLMFFESFNKLDLFPKCLLSSVFLINDSVRLVGLWGIFGCRARAILPKTETRTLEESEMCHWSLSFHVTATAYMSLTYSTLTKFRISYDILE